jgi:Family of unknown function (DUF5681)
MAKSNNPNIAEEGKPHRWKKGQSGNPSGRPKSKTLSDAYRKSQSRTTRKVARGRSLSLKRRFAMLCAEMCKPPGKSPIVRKVERDKP